jgi:hypothetical protein
MPPESAGPSAEVCMGDTSRPTANASEKLFIKYGRERERSEKKNRRRGGGGGGGGGGGEGGWVLR